MGQETRLPAVGNRFIWARKTACLVFTEGRCIERCICKDTGLGYVCSMQWSVCLYSVLLLVERLNVSSFCPL